MSLEILALLNLPKEGQEAIIKSKEISAIRALSCNKNLRDENLELIFNLKDSSATHKALRITKNQERLSRKNLKGARALSIISNPSTHPDILIENLASEEIQRALAAYTNPSTPYQNRIDGLTPSLASDMVEVNGNVGDRVVRAYALVENNPFMKENAGSWSPTIRRAIAGSPDLTIDASNSIRKAGWAHWISHKNHPLLNGLDIKAIETRLLPGFHSSATDLEAINRPDIDFTIARQITTRDSDDAEPNVIAKLVEKFGLAILASATPLAGTRIKSASWLNPSIAYCQKLDASLLAELENSVKIMDSDIEAWSAYIKLYHDWNQSPSELAEAVKRL